MEINTSDIIAFVAAVLSLLSLIISYRFSKKANKLSKRATKISKKALKMARFEYKEKIQPNLKARFEVIGPVSYIILTNGSSGAAKVTQLVPYMENFYFLDTPENGINYPIVLGLNNTYVVYVKFPEDTGDELNFNFDSIDQNWQNNNYALTTRFLVEKMKLVKFEVYFQDVAGSEYMTFLQYNDQSKLYEGVPCEILDHDPAHSKYSKN